MKAYMPLMQGMRRIPDEIVHAFSWRELFAHFRWAHHGVESPGAFVHGLAILGISLCLAAGLAYSRRNSWTPLVVFCLAIAATVSLGRVFDSPNWTVTATQMFRRQCRHLDADSAALTGRKISADERRQAVARLQLPAALKPLERSVRAVIDEDFSLRFKGEAGNAWLADGPKVRLPSGHYRFAMIGAARSAEPRTTGVVEVHVGGIEPYEPHVFRREVRPGGAVGGEYMHEATRVVEGEFKPEHRTGPVQFAIHRIGKLHLRYTRLELECLR
jgi:hypothetical protein